MIYVGSLASVGHGVSEKLKRYAVTTVTYTTKLAEFNMLFSVVCSSGFCKKWMLSTSIKIPRQQSISNDNAA